MKAKISGTGRYIPPHCYNNAFMTAFVGHKSWAKDPARLEKHLGIKTRYFLSELDQETGTSKEIRDELQMAKSAGAQAIESAGLEPKDIDLLIFISCTASSQPAFRNRGHFGRNAGLLHESLGLVQKAIFMELDAGCGGALHAMEFAYQAILSGRRHHVLVVASSAPSQFMDRRFYLEQDAVLAPLIFGDGAGALVLSASRNGRGIVESVTFVDPSLPLMDMRGGLGDTTLAYWIDAKGVKNSFGVKARHALHELSAKVPNVMTSDAFLFHQANGRVLDRFVEEMEIDPIRAPKNIDKYGNTAAAATLILLDEELREQRIGAGSRITFCTVGAGAQWGAMHIVL